MLYAKRMEHDTVSAIRRKYEMLCPSMNERVRRLWAGAEAQLIGRGGITRVSKATGVAHTTIRSAIRELAAQAGAQAAGWWSRANSRVRRSGWVGGRGVGRNAEKPSGPACC